MAKNKWTPEDDKGQEEKFRTFFTTSVADIPLNMKRRDDEEEPSHGIFDRLFHHGGKAKEEPAAEPAPEPGATTGEILLGVPEEEPMADLELAHEEAQEQSAADFFAEPAQDAEKAEQATVLPVIEGPAHGPKPAQEPVPAPAPVAEPAPVSEPEKKAEPAPAPVPEPEKRKEPAPAPLPTPTPAPEPKPEPPKQSTAPEAPKAAAPVPERSAVLPLEEEESHELAELKALLNRMSAARAAEAQRTAPAPVKPKPKPAPAKQPAQPSAQTSSFAFAAEDQPAPKQPGPGPKLFGSTEEKAPDADDTMSLPLLSEEEAAAAESAAAPEAPAEGPAPAQGTAEESPAEQPAAPVAVVEGEPVGEAPDNSPEGVAERLKLMSASLTMRCIVSGLLAFVLLHLGLSAEGRVTPVGGLDPVATPSAFYLVNLLLLGGSAFIGSSVLRDGLNGLRGRPSSETMPALAMVAALFQAFIAFANASSYAPSSLTLLSGIAALGIFMALLGNRIQLAAVRDSFSLLNSGVEQQGAYRARDKDLIRSLSRDLEQKDPWILLSRPLSWDESLIDRCFDERASERRTRKISLVLLGVALLSGLLFLLFGAGINGCAAAMTAVLCMGAPLSSTLIVGLASLRLQRAAGAVGAMVPGWAAIEELGGIDTIQVDADELFGADCVNLEDIRIFKGGRIDRAILYTASVLNSCCNTLRGLFRQIIEDRTDILYPVKDLEVHRGLGFAGWCDNNHILFGTRAYMEQEGVVLPEQEYEDKHSHNGELQILYLAVSGNLHAMFVLKYQGGRNAARGLAVLQRENIRLLVSCQDPSLTARHITEAYRLPEGMVTLLDGSQCAEVEAASGSSAEAPCCMVHLKSFASLTGGLQAAEQAQNAETSATTVQIVSMVVSALIGLLLTSAGSIGALSVPTVLMYQAAWSALSIAICALKQHR